MAELKKNINAKNSHNFLIKLRQQMMNDQTDRQIVRQASRQTVRQRGCKRDYEKKRFLESRLIVI